MHAESGRCVSASAPSAYRPRVEQVQSTPRATRDARRGKTAVPGFCGRPHTWITSGPHFATHVQELMDGAGPFSADPFSAIDDSRDCLRAAARNLKADTERILYNEAWVEVCFYGCEGGWFLCARALSKVVLVDDHSQLDELSLLPEHLERLQRQLPPEKVRLVRRSIHNGIVGARNAGAKEARYPILVILDSHAQ
ncbi:unnamed protein product, partial [Prorocentrum cordatum]